MAPTKNPTLLKWLDEMTELMQPANIVWIDGSEEQLEALRSIGCDYVQGYIWGRPMSAEDAEKLINDML